MSLHLYAFRPDLPRLLRLAARERLLPPGDDPGYAVHAAFAATFGEQAPKPWALLAPGEGGGPAGRLFAYGTQPLAVLRAHAETFADPAFSAPLRLDDACDRPMPDTFAVGTRLGFRVRVRPVARQGKPLPGHASVVDRAGKARERDVYLARIEAAERVAAGSGDTASGEVGVVLPTRAECYLEWLDARLQEGGASVARSHAGGRDGWAAQLTGFRRTRLLGRDRSGARATSRHPEGPDATITGTLTIVDPERFATGLARGVGRFRAFGFGMLLLSPPRG